MLSFKEIRELIDLVSERHLAGLEIEQAGFRVRIEGVHPAAETGTASAPAQPARASRLLESAAATPPAPVEDKTLHVITSPIVGTFYRSPSPEADAFADVGQRVARGKILCIIESMKLMNEIESDVEGEIVEVYPRNGQPVEYGEKLFAIRRGRVSVKRVPASPPGVLAPRRLPCSRKSSSPTAARSRCGSSRRAASSGSRRSRSTARRIATRSTCATRTRTSASGRTPRRLRT